MSGQDQQRQAPGALLFAAIFLCLSVFLVSQLGAETKFAPLEKIVGKHLDALGQWLSGEEVKRVRGKLFAQPAFWPAVAVVGMTVFGALHLASVWRRREGGGRSGELTEALQWLRSLEYLGWFMAYVWAAPAIGYLPATLVFTTALALRSGYRGGRTLMAAAATGLAIVLTFKTVLSVKIPGGALYEHLPDALRTFMIVNF